MKKLKVDKDSDDTRITGKTLAYIEAFYEYCI